MGDPSSPTVGQTATELQQQIELEGAGRTFLVFRDHAGRQNLVDITESSRLTIGRFEENDICLNDDQISRVHAQMEAVGGTWLIADQGLSTNGTYVNGRRLTGKLRLADRDLIKIGQTGILFRATRKNDDRGPTEATDETAVARDLTPLQRQVLVELCRPFADGDPSAVPATNPDIARSLHLSVDAVKGHLRVLFVRYGLVALPQNEKRRRLVDSALRSGAVLPSELTK